MKEIVRISSVSAGYGDDVVIKNVDLSIYEFDYLGLIGPNGGGKTTLLKVILGLIKPVSGEVKVNIGNSLGYVPQAKFIDKRFPIRVFDVVMSGLISKRALFEAKRSEHAVQVNNILEKMGVRHLSQKPIGDLSGGQLQRVFMSRALVNSPRLLLLDEPSAYVDKESESNFYNLLQELNREMAIVLVSHDIGVISSYIKNIACVNMSLCYHDSNEVTKEIMDTYACAVDLITHRPDCVSRKET